MKIEPLLEKYSSQKGIRGLIQLPLCIPVQSWKSNIYFLRILLFSFSLSMISTEAAQVLNPRFESGNLENWSVTSSDATGTNPLSNGFDADDITYTNGIINNLGTYIAYANTILGSRDNVTFTAEVYEDDEQSIQLIEADTDIEFTIAVGNNDFDDASDFGAAAQATLAIGYLSTEQDISTFTLIKSTSFDDGTINAGGDNSFSDFSLSTSISSASPAIGKQLAVRVSFEAPSTGQTNRQSILDNVRVSVVDPSESIHYKVYLLGGQSNAVGRGDDSDLTSPLSDPQTDVAFYFRSTATANNLGHLLEETIIPLNTGSGHGTGAPVSEREFGSEISFGRQMADDHPNENLMIIKYAEGGTSLYTDWAPDGTQYIIFLETVENALAELTAAGHTYELGGMLWIQGEADRTYAYSLAYEERLISLIRRVRIDLFNGFYCPFIISGLSENQTADVHTSGTGAYNVRQAQEAVANDLPQVAFVDTDDFEVRPKNVIHFDTQGLLDMGYAFAAAIQAEESNDLDKDGLTLAEEIALGTDPDNCDSDGDGYHDGMELDLGTDPTIARSVFQIIDTEWGDQSVTLSWTSVSGNCYSVEQSFDLTGWGILEESLPAAESDSQTDYTTDVFGKAFYRVSWEP